MIPTHKIFNFPLLICMYIPPLAATINHLHPAAFGEHNILFSCDYADMLAHRFEWDFFINESGTYLNKQRNLYVWVSMCYMLQLKDVAREFLNYPEWSIYFVILLLMNGWNEWKLLTRALQLDNIFACRDCEVKKNTTKCIAG